MPFCGPVHKPSLRKQLMRAFKKGGYACNGNREVHVHGDVREIQTFAGPCWRLDGKVDCFYYGAHILSLDLVNKKVTDYGMRDYSTCTSNTIRGWVDLLFNMFGLGQYRYSYRAWMKRPRPNTDYARFVTRVPWAGDGWFHWEQFDQALADQYDEGQAFLRKNQNWRWFGYDWDQNGNWSRKFINADAERRYRQREKRWQRTSTTTKNLSKDFSILVAASNSLMLP